MNSLSMGQAVTISTMYRTVAYYLTDLQPTYSICRRKVSFEAKLTHVQLQRGLTIHICCSTTEIAIPTFPEMVLAVMAWWWEIGNSPESSVWCKTSCYHVCGTWKNWECGEPTSFIGVLPEAVGLHRWTRVKTTEVWPASAAQKAGAPNHPTPVFSRASHSPTLYLRVSQPWISSCF